MPVLTNNRRELFAQLLFQGFTAVDAYEKAGFKRHSGNASILARHPEIEARIEEIRAEAKAALVPVGTSAIAARAKVTAESLIEEAEEVRAGAVSNHQYAAANGAIKVKSVLSGNWIERAEIGGPGEFDHLSDAELEAAVRSGWSRSAGCRCLRSPTDRSRSMARAMMSDPATIWRVAKRSGARHQDCPKFAAVLRQVWRRKPDQLQREGTLEGY